MIQLQKVIFSYFFLIIGLTFMFQNLALYPEIQEKLRKEILSLNESPTHENTKKLEYLNAFIKENLRKYGAVTTVIRVTGEDMTLEDYFLPKGTQVAVNVRAINDSVEV